MEWIYHRHSSLEERLKVAATIQSVHPGCIPVVLGKVPQDGGPIVQFKKYVVPRDTSFDTFYFDLHKTLQIRSNQGLSMHVAGSLPADNMGMDSLYDLYRHEDNHLYITYNILTVKPPNKQREKKPEVYW